MPENQTSEPNSTTPRSSGSASCSPRFASPEHTTIKLLDAGAVCYSIAVGWSEEMLIEQINKLIELNNDARPTCLFKPCSPFILRTFPKPCKPRKPHNCRLCGEVIAIKEECCRWSGFCDGPFTSHAHPECYDATERWGCDGMEWEGLSSGDCERPPVRMFWENA